MRMFRLIGLIAVGVFAALAASAQEARIYHSIAVMDFRFSGVTEEQMHAVVDRLSLKILETQGIRRVVSREQREQLLPEAGLGGGSYEKRQLRNAAIVEAELAVLGEIRQDGSGYRIDLWLVEVAGTDTLYRNQLSYASVDEILRDADQLASELIRASRQPRIVEPDDRGGPRRGEPALEAAAGFRIGQESVTAAPGIDGGSHLYAEVLAEFNRAFTVGLRYSIGLFPTYSKNHLIMVLPRINIRLGDELYTAISAGYLLSTDYRNEPHHYLGARLIPIHSGNMEGISIELLPFSVFFDLESGKPVFMFELLSLAFWLSAE